jgi:hypothetical protein
MLRKGCFIRACYSIVNLDLNKQIRQVNQPHYGWQTEICAILIKLQEVSKKRVRKSWFQCRCSAIMAGKLKYVQF